MLSALTVKLPSRRTIVARGRVVGRLLLTCAILLGMLPSPQPAYAASGAYSLKWTAADPAVNSGTYLPTYQKQPPSALACPTPSGGVGRAADPLKDAVAYGPTFSSNNL